MYPHRLEPGLGQKRGHDRPPRTDASSMHKLSKHITWFELLFASYFHFRFQYVSAFRRCFELFSGCRTVASRSKSLDMEPSDGRAKLQPSAAVFCDQKRWSCLDSNSILLESKHFVVCPRIFALV